MPVYLATRVPNERDRVTVLVRLILMIPQVIVLGLLGFVGFFVAVAGWFGALFTGRLPEFARNFLTGYLRWSTRVGAYGLLLTDAYPPFSFDLEERYPVHIAVPPATDLNRLAVLVRIFLAIPALIVTSVLNSGATVLSIVSWFAIMFTGQMPPALFEAERASLRYQTRFWAYLFMLTPDYPADVMGDTTAPGTVDEAWLVRLSSQGRTAMVVLIVVGVIWEIVSYGRRF
jgi:hypothetical protein